MPAHAHINITRLLVTWANGFQLHFAMMSLEFECQVNTFTAPQRFIYHRHKPILIREVQKNDDQFIHSPRRDEGICISSCASKFVMHWMRAFSLYICLRHMRFRPVCFLAQLFTFESGLCPPMSSGTSLTKWDIKPYIKPVFLFLMHPRTRSLHSLLSSNTKRPLSPN